jgi:hypothetical protein
MRAGREIFGSRGGKVRARRKFGQSGEDPGAREGLKVQ